MTRLKGMFDGFASFLPKLRTLPRDPTRRAYYKKVHRHIKKGVPILESDTPDMIADKIRPAEDIDALTAEYEQVRYGRE